MHTLQFVLLSTFSLMVLGSGIVTREYLPPTRNYLQSTGNLQLYYPNRPILSTGGYYQQGLGNYGLGGGYYLGGNTGLNQYYNPSYTPGYGSEYYVAGLGGGTGSGNYYNTGLGNGGLYTQVQINKPRPRTVLTSEDGYIYGKKK